VSGQLNAFQRASSVWGARHSGARGETAAAGVAGRALRMLQYIPAKWHIHHAHVAEALTTKMQEGARVLTPLKLPETRLSRVRARSESSGSDAEATRTRSRLCGSTPPAPDAAAAATTTGDLNVRGQARRGWCVADQRKPPSHLWMRVSVRRAPRCTSFHNRRRSRTIQCRMRGRGTRDA